MNAAPRRSLFPAALAVGLAGLNWLCLGAYCVVRGVFAFYVMRGRDFAFEPPPRLALLLAVSLLTLAAWTGRNDRRARWVTAGATVLCSAWLAAFSAAFGGYTGYIDDDLLQSFIFWPRLWLALSGSVLVYSVICSRPPRNPVSDDQPFGRLILKLTVLLHGLIFLLVVYLAGLRLDTLWSSFVLHFVPLAFILPPMLLAGRTRPVFNNYLAAGLTTALLLALAALSHEDWRQEEVFLAVAISGLACSWLPAVATAAGLALGLDRAGRYVFRLETGRPKEALLYQEYGPFSFPPSPIRRLMRLAAAGLVMAGLITAGLYHISRLDIKPLVYDGPWRTVFAGRLRLEVPAEAILSADAYYSHTVVINWPDGRRLNLLEEPFSPEKPPEAQFQDAYKKLLPAKPGTLTSVQDEDLSEIFGRPARLVVRKSQNFDLYLAWPEGWLLFRDQEDSPSEKGRKAPPFLTMEESRASFLARVEEFLPAYQWLNSEQSPPAEAWKTERGLIRPGPKANFSLTSRINFTAPSLGRYRILALLGDAAFFPADVGITHINSIALRMASALFDLTASHPVNLERNRPLTVAGLPGEIFELDRRQRRSPSAVWHHYTSDTRNRQKAWLKLRFFLRRTNRFESSVGDYPAALGIFEEVLKRAAWLDEPPAD